MKDMVRVYLSDFRITRETIDEVFRSHGDVLPEAEIERLGHFLNWKDPVLVAGPERFGWDLVRGNPLFHAYQAAREDEPSICFTVRESEDSGRTTKGLDGLSCRKTPFHGIVGISPAEVVRKGVFDGARFQRPALGQWLVLKTYEMDGFEAVDSFLETHSHGKPVRTETGVFATMTAAEEAFKKPVAAVVLARMSPGSFIVLSATPDIHASPWRLYVRTQEGADLYDLSPGHPGEEGWIHEWISKGSLPLENMNEYFSDGTSRVLIAEENLPLSAQNAANRLAGLDGARGSGLLPSLDGDHPVVPASPEPPL